MVQLGVRTARSRATSIGGELMAGKRGNGEGTIAPRRDGRWEARISIGNGKRKTLYGKSRREVQTKLDAARRALQDGLPAVPERQTVGSFLKQWLEGIKPTIRAKTWETYELNVRRVTPHLGPLRVAGLTPADVQACYAALLDRGLSRRSVRQSHEMLHKAIAQAVEWGMLHRNVTESASPPRPDRKEMQTLTQAQVQKLFKSTADDWLHALWVTLITTGLRLGEATGLRWRDVDLDTATLTVRRALQRRRTGELEFVEPKSAHSRRTVELSEHTVRVLRAQRQKQTATGLTSLLVFPNTTGGPLGPETVRDGLKRALSTATLPSVRVHDLRHTAATLLLEWGQHPKVVQEMLGHSTIAITLDLYSHVAPRIHKEAAKQFARLF
jgi:integrase